MKEGIQVALKAILYRPDGTFLTLRRSETAPIRPFEWDLPGGELEEGEEAEAGMVREIAEETGLSVPDVELFHAISRFNKQNEFWLTLLYIAPLPSENITLSFEHDDFRFVTAEEFQTLPASNRLKEFARRFAQKRHSTAA